MEKIEKLFGTVVRRHREALGHSQEDFADMVGIHRTYVSSIELGKVGISIGIAEKLSQGLETTLSQLFKEVEALRRKRQKS